MEHRAILIRGDGTGPELADAVIRIIEASGVRIKWEDADAGEQCLLAGEQIVPERTIEAIRRTKVALKGPISTPVGKGSVSANVTLRKKLGARQRQQKKESDCRSQSKYHENQRWPVPASMSGSFQRVSRHRIQRCDRR